jgi:hypothetical protein
MEPVLFVMAILGCGDDGQQCSQQRVEPVHYASAAACQAAVPRALMRNTDVDYPVVGAECQPLTRRLAGEKRPVPARAGG